jgi:hypothetical protein
MSVKTMAEVVASDAASASVWLSASLSVNLTVRG